MSPEVNKVGHKAATHHNESLHQDHSPEIPAPNNQKKQIIVFGKESFFLKNFLQNLKSSYDMNLFHDPEKACNHCIEKKINYILLDMDPPTDWKLSTDVFTTVRTLNPGVQFFLLTKEKNVPVDTLAAQGGIILRKPIQLDQLSKAIGK